MAANRTTEGIRYASFLEGIRAPVIVAQDSFIFSLLFPMAIDKSSDSNAMPAIINRFSGFRGLADGPGSAAPRAVVVTPMFTMAGVEPDRSTGAPGPLQVACFGAPVQVMVTFKDPVPPPVSASCRL
jgi:hypothetical protein